MTLVVKHATLTGVAADSTALIDGPAWDANHALTGTADASQLNSNVVQSVTNDTNVTGSIVTQVLTIGWTGTLAETRGGTNQSTYTLGDTLYSSAANTLSKLAGNTTSTKKFLRQTGTGTVSAAPAWDTIVAADVPGSALTKTDDTNVTLTLGGSSSTALLNAASITVGWTGTLAAGRLNSNVVQSVVNDTNVTGSISAQALTFSWSGTLSPTRGGTGVNNGTNTITLSGNNTATTSWTAPLFNASTAASGYQLGGTQILYVSSSIYTAINDPSGSVKFFFGNASDKTSYFNNDFYRWRAADGTTVLAVLDSTGFSIPNGIKSTSASSGVGYATGAGGTVTQATSRTTGVTLNTVTGAITLVSAAGSASFQTFTLTNSSINATDVVHVTQKSGTDKYQIFVTNTAGGSCAITFATTGGTTTEQPVFSFVVLKGVTS